MKSLNFKIVIVLFLFSGCDNSTNDIIDLNSKRVNLSINNLQKFNKSLQWETLQNYKWYVKKPKLEEQIHQTIQKLNKVSSDLQTQISKQTIDCSSVIEQLLDSYKLIESQYSITVDSIESVAKLFGKDANNAKQKFKEKIDYENLKISSCKFNVTENNLLFELLMFNNAITTYINEISMFTPWDRPVYERIPILVPEKKIYRPGEQFVSDIYIGNIINSGFSNEFIEVNKKEYELNNNKIEFAEVVPDQIGLRELKIVYKKENIYSKQTETIKEVIFNYEIK
jgi:DNA mismatch repair ATPase MutS